MGYTSFMAVPLQRNNNYLGVAVIYDAFLDLLYLFSKNYINHSSVSTSKDVYKKDFYYLQCAVINLELNFENEAKRSKKHRAGMANLFIPLLRYLSTFQYLIFTEFYINIAGVSNFIEFIF